MPPADPEHEKTDPAEPVDGPDFSPQSLRGIAYGEHRFEHVDEDFEYLDAPATTAVKAAWEHYLAQVSEHGRFLKSRLSLRAMAPFAHYLWMIEHHADDDFFSVRLWSTGTTEIIGKDMTGALVEEDGIIAKWARLYRQLLRTGNPVILRNKMSESGQSFLTMEVAVLPLYDDSASVRYILCPYSLL